MSETQHLSLSVSTSLLFMKSLSVMQHPGFNETRTPYGILHFESVFTFLCRLCCQWVPDDGGFPSSFAECGPLKMDPQIAESAQNMYATGTVLFPIPFMYDLRGILSVFAGMYLNHSEDE